MTIKKSFKCLALNQPWGTLLTLPGDIRYKQFDTRSWGTSYRGPVAIQVTKPKKDTKFWLEEFKDLLQGVNLPFGAVIAIAELEDCIKMDNKLISSMSETELRCGVWTVGRYAWKFKNVKVLKKPIPAKGSLGLYTWQTSEDLKFI